MRVAVVAGAFRRADFAVDFHCTRFRSRRTKVYIVFILPPPSFGDVAEPFTAGGRFLVKSSEVIEGFLWADWAVMLIADISEKPSARVLDMCLCIELLKRNILNPDNDVSSL